MDQDCCFHSNVEDRPLTRPFTQNVLVVVSGHQYWAFHLELHQLALCAYPNEACWGGSFLGCLVTCALKSVQRVTLWQTPAGIRGRQKYFLPDRFRPSSQGGGATKQDFRRWMTLLPIYYYYYSPCPQLFNVTSLSFSTGPIETEVSILQESFGLMHIVSCFLCNELPS